MPWSNTPSDEATQGWDSRPQPPNSTARSGALLAWLVAVIVVLILAAVATPQYQTSLPSQVHRGPEALERTADSSSMGAPAHPNQSPRPVFPTPVPDAQREVDLPRPSLPRPHPSAELRSLEPERGSRKAGGGLPSAEPELEVEAMDSGAPARTRPSPLRGPYAAEDDDEIAALEAQARALATLAGEAGASRQPARRAKLRQDEAEFAAQPPARHSARPSSAAAGGSSSVTPAQREARRYLARSDSLEGLRFQPATGYWANTYLPGDPAMRLLEARLSQRDPRAWNGPLRLELAARRNWQPFDPPRKAALALYLQSDRAAVHGPTRMRVELGLKGLSRQAGLRPAMNLGLVLDLRALPLQDTGTRFRALVNALLAAHQPGDRFSITVAGRPGGVIVPAEAFRNGPIRLAMERLFGGAAAAPGVGLNLMQALTQAASAVRANDDPMAALGTSMILLVTDAALGRELAAVERFVHGQALEGVPVSVAVVGEGADLDEIDRIVRAGQGNRRILGGAAEADALVQNELRALSRVVARAVRVRIRLAPHVKLVEVLGSRRLDVVQAQRVRDAEQSIDRRLARNLGLDADRGEDEEGIQIVIPSFLAGDTHVVLLDVVAERSGFIADAQIRYKDLVRLRNGVARTRLTVPEGEREPGPLQLRVLKNRLAQETAEAARRASRSLRRGDPQRARAELTRVRNLLVGMTMEVPGWSQDPELSADVAMLGSYLAALNAAPADGARHGLLADSLRYAAHRRLLAAR